MQGKEKQPIFKCHRLRQVISLAPLAFLAFCSYLLDLNIPTPPLFVCLSDSLSVSLTLSVYVTLSLCDFSISAFSAPPPPPPPRPAANLSPCLFVCLTLQTCLHFCQIYRLPLFSAVKQPYRLRQSQTDRETERQTQETGTEERDREWG